MSWIFTFLVIAWLVAGTRRLAKHKNLVDELARRLGEAEGRLDRLERNDRVAHHDQPLAPEQLAMTTAEYDAAAGIPVHAGEPLHGPDEVKVRENKAESIIHPESALLESGAAAEAPATVETGQISEIDQKWRSLEHKYSGFNQEWRGLERKFVENWTGVLGAAVVVAGVGFLGIYTALHLAPVYRFFLTIAFSGAFLGTSALLHRRERWRMFAHWVRSAGAAIFLFACAASGGLPGFGMQWIQAAMPAFALLLLGMAVNLYFAWVGGTQAFASLHVILSLLPLAIVPPSIASLAIAVAVTLFGISLSFRSRWDRHLMNVLWAYFLFHVSWYLQMDPAIHAEADDHRIIGRLGALIVFIAAALVHYRKDYASQKVEPGPLRVHLSNWAILAVTLLAYRADLALLRAIVLALAGVAAYLLARRARPLGVRWLYLCDTLIGQALSIAAVVSLQPLIANIQLIMLAVFLETVLFLRLVIDEGETSLAKVAWLSVLGAGFLSTLVGIFGYGSEFAVTLGSRVLPQNAYIAFAGVAAATVAQLYLTRRHGESMRALDGNPLPLAVLGWLVGAMAVAGLVNLTDTVWMETASLVVLGVLLYVARSASPPGLMAGAAAAVLILHVKSWSILLTHAPWEPISLTVHLGPLLSLAAFGIWAARSGALQKGAIYLSGADIAFAVYLFFAPVSPLIPGVVWLLLSLFALELANRLKGPNAVAPLFLGYGYLAAFVGDYSLVILQTPAYIELLPARLLIEFLAIGVILYWWFYHPHAVLVEHPAWLRAHPFFLEFSLIAAATTNMVEVPTQWQSLVWSALSLALLVPPAVRHLDRRLPMYSLVFYWMSVAGVAVTMSTFESPSPTWYDRPYFPSLLAIALQVAYIVAAHLRLTLANECFPHGLGLLARLGKAVAARRNLWVYYPFIAGVALFLFDRFDHSVLTLLWAAEAFGVFVLSAVLRENSFRYVALTGLGVCLLRLLLIDMVEANLGFRGLVFLGVGLLMLGMNAIYNGYRARFE